MATGTSPFEEHPDPWINGCGEGIFCDGDFFHEDIMGRSPSEIEAEAQRAKDFFKARFGLDVDKLVRKGRLAFEPLFLDPRGEYRAYTVAGDIVNPEGWVVRDGGFIATVLDKKGVPMGGEFADSGLPPTQQNGLLLYGNYNIQTTNPQGDPRGEIVVNHRSGTPMIANDWG